MKIFRPLHSPARPHPRPRSPAHLTKFRGTTMGPKQMGPNAHPRPRPRTLTHLVRGLQGTTTYQKNTFPHPPSKTTKAISSEPPRFSRMQRWIKKTLIAGTHPKVQKTKCRRQKLGSTQPLRKTSKRHPPSQTTKAISPEPPKVSRMQRWIKKTLIAGTHPKLQETKCRRQKLGSTQPLRKTSKRYHFPFFL